MKIGIVTYHRTLNYGAVLQALATRYLLEQYGHEVYYVDYWPEYHRNSYELFSFSQFCKKDLKGKLKYLLDTVKFYSDKKKRIANFDSFMRQYIYPYCRSLSENFDVVLYGSDQIWRKQKALKAYNPFYFGKNDLKTSKHISFAASMGMMPSEPNDRDVLKDLLSHLDAISVRENDLLKLVNELGYYNAVQSLDPTLMIPAVTWNEKIPTKPYSGRPYALVYVMGTNGFNMKEVRKYTDSKGLDLKVIRGYAATKSTESNITTAGPQEFIRLIANADVVFSSSFHGLAFSIIYRKEVFASFVRNSGRAQSLLDLLGIGERLLPAKTAIPSGISTIDYGKVDEKLNVAQSQVMNFLGNIVFNC